MELNQVVITGGENFIQVEQIEIDEYSDSADFRGQCLDNFFCLFGKNITGTLRIEYEPDCVCPGLASGKGIFLIGYSANLDFNHGATPRAF
jgi:hypothetical protein